MKILCYLIILILSTSLIGQNRVNYFGDEGKDDQNGKMSKATQPGDILNIDFYTSEQVLEQKIDADQYILGPGDILFVNIGGMIQKSFPVEVLPEENIIIPEIGVFDLGNKTLSEFKKEATEKLADYFKDTDISIYIVKIRQFRVYVTGQVKQPGTYFVSQIDRLNDIIALAGGLQEWADHTKIQINNHSSTKTFNHSAFLNMGNMDENPLINQEDVIFVPAIDLEKSVVKIEGNISRTGYYQIEPDEEMIGFLARTGAFTRSSEFKEIILKRNDEIQKINLLEKSEKVMLKNGDIVSILREKMEVYVSGEVIKPGSFPYHPYYTAWDYVALAGLMESSVNVNEVTVIRFETGEVIEGRNTIVNNGDIVKINRKFRDDIKDYINILTPIISLGLSAYVIITR